MTNEELMAAILALPAPDLLSATSSDDAPGDGAFYSARTVARLLAEQRQALAGKALCPMWRSNSCTCSADRCEGRIALPDVADTPNAVVSGAPTDAKE